jgi:hypothetical protein
VLLQAQVAPPSSERAVLKFASVRSLKYTLPVLSTASSVSPPPAHATALPVCGAELGTHLNVCPPSSERQIQLVSDESAPGTLAYTRAELVGSKRRSSSKPTPWTPTIVGWPKLGVPAATKVRAARAGNVRGRSAHALPGLAPEAGARASPSSALLSLSTIASRVLTAADRLESPARACTMETAAAATSTAATAARRPLRFIDSPPERKCR